MDFSKLLIDSYTESTETWNHSVDHAFHSHSFVCFSPTVLSKHHPCPPLKPLAQYLDCLLTLILFVFMCCEYYLFRA